MTLNGWIGIPRSVLSAEWYVQADPFTRALWLHMMLSANFAPTVTRTGLAVSPGQIVTSWNALAAALSWHDRERHRVERPTVAKCRRAAAFLEKAGEATWAPTGAPYRTGIVVTLERWAFYASELEASADPEADATADRLPEPRQHRKNTTGSADHQERQSANSVVREFREHVEKSKRDRREVLEVRRREREGAPTPRGAGVGDAPSGPSSEPPKHGDYNPSQVSTGQEVE